MFCCRINFINFTFYFTHQICFNLFSVSHQRKNVAGLLQAFQVFCAETTTTSVLERFLAGDLLQLIITCNSCY